jgi:hypothetical protein
VTVTAVSQANGNVTASDTGTATVLPLGVQIEIVSGPSGVNPGQTAVWQVEVTNSGQTADSYDLSAAGIVALNGTFTPASVALSAGQSQVVQFSSSIESPPASYPFAVVARSTSDARVVAEDTAVVAVNGIEAVTVQWNPIAQTVTDTLTATFQIAISNTGSLATQYNLTLDLGAASGSLPIAAMVLPAQTGFVQEVTVVVPQVGVYELALTAVSPAGTTDEAMAVLTAVASTTPPPDGLTIYLPFISKNSN